MFLAKVNALLVREVARDPKLLDLESGDLDTKITDLLDKVDHQYQVPTQLKYIGRQQGIIIGD